MLLLFLNCSFWGSFKCICSRMFSMIYKCLAEFTALVLLTFLPMFLPIFLAKGKNHNLSQIFDLLVELNSASVFIFYTLKGHWCRFENLPISLSLYDIFILSSISSRLEFWSVNRTSINENSELKFFKNKKFLGEVSNN